MDLQEVKNIYADPRCMFNYASYYIYGFEKLFGKKFLFKGSFFEDFPMKTYEDYRKGFALVVETMEHQYKRIYIDFNDSPKNHFEFYQWADLYCKINLTEKEILPKTLIIGPSFGISLYGYLKLFKVFVCNLFEIVKMQGYHPDVKILLRDYLYSNIRRVKFNRYQLKKSVDENYCFSVSTLWYGSEMDCTTNYYRGIFTRLVAKIFPKFEGGFFYIDSKSVLKEYPIYTKYKNEYKGLLLTKRIHLCHYIEKIGKSLLTFNTPAVCGCIGWKLPEYLCLGKAIISTEIKNLMPGSFVAGKHYLLVHSLEEIEKAIFRIKNDSELRHFLEVNAKSYFDTYLAPEKVVKRIIMAL